MNFGEFLTQLFSNLFNGNVIALLAGTLTATITGIGSAKGVSNVGTAMAGVLTEDPSKYGKLLLLQALPGTQGIYGLMTWFILMVRMGYLGGSPVALTMVQGFLVLAACLPMIVVGYKSALLQARVATSGVMLVGKRPESQAQAVVMAAMVETYAIFALLTSMMTIFFII